MARPRICLNMIVKNEAHIIQRCLDSALPWIDSWIIVDTGSTDGTQEFVRRHLARVPGELHERPWQNFGKNRTEALELARPTADYLLFLDADDVLTVADGTPRPELGAGGHYMRVEVGASTSFSRVNLVSTRLPWRWEGAVHEVVTCPEPHQIEHLEGWTIRSLADSARNRDPAGKFLRDAAMLEAAVAEDPTHTRNVFYLAQSYRDAGELERAIEWYERRITLGGWEEEVWYSRFQIAVLHERRGNWQMALPGYLAAFQYRPARLEPLCELARHYRVAGEHALAHLFAAAALDRPAPNDILFLDDSVYAWRALDEYAISAYWVGKYEESLRANERLLDEGKLPAAERARIEKNRAFCVGKLGSG
jgi:glycosyltransferase involved in cell wall biosynthesis